MNEMELLGELARETPLPAPVDLDAARARLAAAIAADPAAGGSTAAPEAAMYQPCASSGQPVGPLRPAAPAPVLTAVKFMYSGAVGTAVYLIISLFYLGDVKAYHVKVLGRRLTAAQLSDWRPLIVALVVVVGVALIALWVWMARAVGQGRNWARILSTVLVALATLGLNGDHGIAQVFCAWVTWLTGLAAVGLLWRRTSSAFFNRCLQAALTRQP